MCGNGSNYIRRRARPLTTQCQSAATKIVGGMRRKKFLSDARNIVQSQSFANSMELRMQETTDLLQQAIQARIKGYNLIPLRGGDVNDENFKRPAVSWDQYKSNLSTITEIRQWHEQNPDLRYGIVTGPVSKLFVVDLDTAEGEKWFFEHEPSITKLSSACVKTRKGWHVYFRWSDELNEKVTTKVRIAEGVDIRGEGGYVVAWNVRQLVDIGKLPQVPRWILDLLPGRKTGGNLEGKRVLTHDWMAEAFANLKVGNRNDTFTRIAGSLRNRGYSANALFEILKGKAESVGFGLDELRTICDSVGRYEPSSGASSDNGDIGESKTLSEILASRKPTEWIIQDIVPAEAIVFVAGLEGTGKSWLTADLAIEAARDHGLWLGRFPVKKSRVLYIEQERSVNETARRMAALISHKEISPSLLNDTLRLKLKAGLHVDRDNAYNAFHRELSEYRPELVIVDSFGTFTSLDPNNTSEMQHMMERIKALRSEFKCTFMFVYHENKGAYERARDKKMAVTHEFLAGSSALARAAETIFIVEGKGGKESMVHQTKNNPGELCAPISFTYQNATPDRQKIVVKVI